MWFLHQFSPESAAYNLTYVVRINGSLDLIALEKSFQAVVDRYESLRTTFTFLDGSPVQIIHPTLEVRLPVIDLDLVSATDRLNEAILLIQNESHKPFNLETGPIFRVQVYKLTRTDYILGLFINHINSDQWSMQILGRDILAFYEAYHTGETPTLPVLPIQYADYAHWQRSHFQDENLKQQLAYWKKQLKDLTILDLPTDFARPAIQSSFGARHFFQLSNPLVYALKQVSREEEATLFMTLLAGFLIILAHYSGLKDISVGTPITNRSILETENLIGNFTNTLVLRNDLSKQLTFREFLGRVRETTLNAFTNQDLPFEKLVEELQPDRDLSRSPVIQVLFNPLNPLMKLPDYEGLNFTYIPIDPNVSRLDLSLYINQEPNYGAFFEYNTDLFSPSTIQRMADHLKILLEGIASNPDQLIMEIPILSPMELELLLYRWNATKMDYPSQCCLHQMFEDQAQLTPDALAVIFSDEYLTYRELNDRSNRLAHYLIKLGVGPEVVVGIYCERSIEMVVGLLGVLKAGGAYLPLDPSFPMDRLDFMVKDFHTAVILTQKHLRSTALIPAGVNVVSLDHHDEFESYPSGNPDIAVHPENLAYLLYTSGSTGKPKGVQILHQGVVNFLTSMRAEPGLTSQDTLLSVTSLSFDISVLEIFLPLTTGAKLILADRETALNGELLIHLMSQAGITIMQATPTTWRMLMELGWQGKDDLQVLCGGETLPRVLANQLVKRCASLWNMYGPTETTVWSSVAKVTFGEGPVSIGCPIGNTQMYILDDQNRPVPIGVPGELHIGGDGLARGYLNRPELTKQRFVTVPIQSGSKMRLYKTGDLARYLPDGKIEYLGRMDHQVKVRGFRIELGEIETLLAEFPEIKEAVVIVREDQPENKKIVAYLIPNDMSTKPISQDLHNYFNAETTRLYGTLSLCFPGIFPFDTEQENRPKISSYTKPMGTRSSE